MIVPRLSWLSPFLTALRAGKYLLYVAICAGIFLTGWEAGTSKYKDAQLAQSQAAIQSVVKGAAQVQVVYIEDLARIQKLQADNKALREKVADDRERIDEYVPKTGVGDHLSVGAVRVLNDAAGIRPDEGQSGAASGEAAGENSQPSTLTWHAFTKNEVTLRGQYNEARNQCNALIDWVETNVVKDPNNNNKKAK